MQVFHVPNFCVCKGTDYGLENKGHAFYVHEKLPRVELQNKDSSADDSQ